MLPKAQAFRTALLGLASLAIAMGIGRFAFTPLLPLMQADGLVSIADGGVLASVHFVGYWLGAMFAASLPTSSRATLRFSLIMIGVCTLGMGLTDNFAIWLCLRGLAGVCSAFTLVLISNGLLKYLANSGHVGKQGWVFAGVGAGIVLAGLGTLAAMASQISSASSWQAFGVLSLAAAILVSLNLGPELDDLKWDAQQPTSRRSPLIWPLIIAYGAAGIGYIIPATYLPVMARDVISEPLVFGWAWPVFGAAAFFSTLLAARLQSRYSNRQIWIASQIVMAVGLLLPIVYAHIATIAAAGICVGGTFMIVTMMGIKEAHRLAPPRDAVRHIAAMTAAFASGQMIGPVLASLLFEATQSFSPSLILTSAVLIATVIPLTRMRSPADSPG